MSLDILGWGKISDFLTDIFNRVIPDPAQKAQAQFQLAQLEQQGEFKLIDTQLQLMQSQTDINKVEAASNSLFVSGWRPYIGWVGGTALAYQYLLRPLIPFLFNLFGHPVPEPMALDNSLQELVYALLGVAGLRTVDKAVPHVTSVFKK